MKTSPAFPMSMVTCSRHGLPFPILTRRLRSTLIDACRFDWAAISPAIFGALFQSVMDAAERRAQGAHYTTEKNILKVIGPLFLDDLRADVQPAPGAQGQAPRRLN